MPHRGNLKGIWTWGAKTGGFCIMNEDLNPMMQIAFANIIFKVSTPQPFVWDYSTKRIWLQL